MVKITKKITAIVLAGILMAGSVGGTPTFVEAKTTKTSSAKKVDWSKKYPKLKNPKKKDIKKVAYSKATNAKINRIIKKLDQLEKKFSMKQLKSIWKDIFDLNIQMTKSDSEHYEKNTQFDYIVYKATYYSFIHTKGKEREKFFTQIADDMCLSAAKRFNSGQQSKFFLDYGVYYKGDLADCFNSERMKKLFVKLNSLLIMIGDRKPGIPDHPDFDDNYVPKVDESILPSNIQSDDGDYDLIEKIPEYNEPQYPPLKVEPVKPEAGTIIGLSFEKYCKEAVKLGFKKTNDFQDPSGTTQEAYGYMVNGILLGNISVCNDFRGRNLQIVMKNGYHTNPSYKKWKATLQKSFNLLLPTQGKELFDIISQKNIKDKIITKTFTMDGREVTVVVDEVKDPKTNKQEQLILVVFR